MMALGVYLYIMITISIRSVKNIDKIGYSLLVDRELKEIVIKKLRRDLSGAF